MRLLLIPSFTELEWGIRPLLEKWAEVATFDMPGVGDEPLPPEIELDPKRAEALLSRWRDEGAKRGIAELDRRGWDRFVVVTDGHGAPTACRLCRERRESVLGLAIGHASLSHSTKGERAPVREAVWSAFGQLTQQGNEAFVRYGIAQMTRGGISEELAQEMLERFPDMEMVAAVVEALGEVPEPIGEDLEAMGAPLLLAKHEGCLGRTDEGFDDIVPRFRMRSRRSARKPARRVRRSRKPCGNSAPASGEWQPGQGWCRDYLLPNPLPRSGSPRLRNAGIHRETPAVKRF